MKSLQVAKLLAVSILTSSLIGCSGRTSNSSIHNVFDTQKNKKSPVEAIPEPAAPIQAPEAAAPKEEASEGAVAVAEKELNQCQLEAIGEITLSALRAAAVFQESAPLIAEYDKTSKKDLNSYLAVIAKSAVAALESIRLGLEASKSLAPLSEAKDENAKINFIGETWKRILALVSDDESAKKNIEVFEQTSKTDKGSLIAAIGEMAKQALPIVASKIDSSDHLATFDNCK